MQRLTRLLALFTDDVAKFNSNIIHGNVNHTLSKKGRLNVFFPFFDDEQQHLLCPVLFTCFIIFHSIMWFLRGSLSRCKKTEGAIPLTG